MAAKSDKKNARAKELSTYPPIFQFLCSGQLRNFAIFIASLFWYLHEKKSVSHILKFPLSSLWDVGGKVSLFAIGANWVADSLPVVATPSIPILLFCSAIYHGNLLRGISK
jgi:hypothetical protein